jgi:hypothetical protein
MVQLTQIISRRNQSSPWRPESLSRRPKLRIKISIEWAGSITNRMGGGIKAEIIRFHSPTKGIRKRRVAVPAKYVWNTIKAICPEHPIRCSKMSCLGESGTIGRTLCSAWNAPRTINVTSWYHTVGLSICWIPVTRARECTGVLIAVIHCTNIGLVEVSTKMILEANSGY